MNGTKTLTVKQQRAIAGLLAMRTYAEAAAAAGTSLPTLYRWMNDPQFRAELDAREAAMIDAAQRAVLRLQENAIATIAGILANAGESASVRLAAAKTALDYSIRLRELAAIERRLAALERAQAPMG